MAEREYAEPRPRSAPGDEPVAQPALVQDVEVERRRLQWRLGLSG